MNIGRIKSLLEQLGIAPELISIGVDADSSWCLVSSEISEDDGAPTWEVYWREQGNRYDWACFTNEQVACYYLYGRLAWSQVLLDKVGLLPPGS